MEIKPHIFELLKPKKHSAIICDLIIFIHLCRMAPSISRMALFDTWVRTPKKSKFDAMMSYVIEEMEGVEKPEAALKCIKSKIRSFYQAFESKLKKIGRHRKRFLDTYFFN